MRSTTLVVASLVWLVSSSVSGEQRAIRAIRTETRPVIDGRIEALWSRADSVTRFVQSEPDEGAPSSQKTVAYFLHDDENLFVAYNCYDAHPEKLVVVSGQRGHASGDIVYLYLDTFGDKVSAYCFGVNAAGVQEDFYISADGKNWDGGWEGIWYCESQVTARGYAVEMQIPFKSLRYKAGQDNWGIGFERGIQRRQEWAFWPAYEGEFRISRLGALEGIAPTDDGSLHLEAYPVAVTRYDRPSSSADAGLDLTWFPSPSSSLQFTSNPDFAQVEADPHQINLSKYERWLRERRPFFVEGMDLFNTWSGMQLMFYSRRIGKRLPNGDEVPIRAGTKLIARPGKYQIGALSVLTGQAEYADGDEIRSEPRSVYSAVRMKRSVLKNSEIGILHNRRDGDGFASVSAVDGEFRFGDLRWGFIGVHADQSDQPDDIGLKTALLWRSSGWHARATAAYTGEDFDVNQVGFFRAEGSKLFYLRGGPIIKNQGPFKRIWTSVHGQWRKRDGSPDPEYFVSVSGDFNLASNWGFWLESESGKRSEEGQNYGYWSGEMWLWSDWSKPVAGDCGIWYNSQEFNYRRDWFGKNVGAEANLRWRLNGGLTLGAEVENTTEFRPDTSVENSAWVSHLTANWAINRTMHLRAWTEPNTDTHIHKMSFLFSWNLRPKSWFYVAYNESRDNVTGDWRLADRILIAKVRYLFWM